jgi:hypothetical protein
MLLNEPERWAVKNVDLMSKKFVLKLHLFLLMRILTCKNNLTMDNGLPVRAFISIEKAQQDNQQSP